MEHILLSPLYNRLIMAPWSLMNSFIESIYPENEGNPKNVFVSIANTSTAPAQPQRKLLTFV